MLSDFCFTQLKNDNGAYGKNYKKSLNSHNSGCASDSHNFWFCSMDVESSNLMVSFKLPSSDPFCHHAMAMKFETK